MIAVNQPDLLLAAMLADIRSFKATKRSLGVIYGMLCGLIPPGDDLWRKVNDRISAYGGGWKYLDDVKGIGWDVHQRIAMSLQAVTKPSDDQQQTTGV